MERPRQSPDDAALKSIGVHRLPRKPSQSSTTAYCAVLTEAPAAGGWVQLLPLGKFQARDGRGPWVIADKAAADQVVAATQAWAGKQDLVIDYDHQSEHALQVQGGVAPAAGWISEVQARADGIYGKVEWTAACSAKLADREYRYISPVFTFSKGPAGAASPVVKLMRAGLTNNPTLAELAAVAALSPDEEDDAPVDLKAIAKALGLADTATFDECVAACSANTKASASVKAIAKAAGLEEAAGETAICAAIAAKGEPDPAKFVPMAAFTELQTAVTGLQTAGVEEKAVAAVTAAMAAGKVSPAMKDWALGYARKDLDAFGTFIAAQPKVVASQTPAGGREIIGDAETLTEEEAAICAQLGADPKIYLELKKKDAA